MLSKPTKEHRISALPKASSARTNNPRSVIIRNIDTARKIIKLVVGRIPETRDCACAAALKTAIVTAPELIPEEEKEKLDLLIGRYIRKA